MDFIKNGYEMEIDMFLDYLRDRAVSIDERQHELKCEMLMLRDGDVPQADKLVPLIENMAESVTLLQRMQAVRAILKIFTDKTGADEIERTEDNAETASGEGDTRA